MSLVTGQAMPTNVIDAGPFLASAGSVAWRLANIGALVTSAAATVIFNVVIIGA